jgi:cytochrome c556
MNKKVTIIAVSLFSLLGLNVSLAHTDERQPLLSVKEIMNGMITPTTTTIWGAYQLETDAQWQEVRNAALSVIAAGNLLQLGGAGEGEIATAAEADWKTYNQQMIEAARLVIVAADNKDEEALSAAGNDALYPPCESCHQQYQTR